MSRYLHATFCDDIRHEIGGKISLVGCYSDKLLVSEFPQRLPKLCAQVLLATEPLYDDTDFTVFIKDQSGNEIVRLEAVVSPSEADKELGVRRIQTLIEIPFIEFKTETTLQVVAVILSEEYTGPTLTIAKRPAA